MYGYAKLANVLTPRSLFYATLAPFVIFYLAFAFILYPLKDVLHPLSIVVPPGGMSFAVNLVRHWTFSLYYIGEVPVLSCHVLSLYANPNIYPLSHPNQH